MGFWGTRLYSGDFAMDLRATVAAVARLPFETNRLIDILRETESTAANNPDDEDYSTFWLVVADQFARRGIISEGLREKAIEIIDSSRDLAMVEKLGMKAADIRKRHNMLQEVRSRVVQAETDRPRKVLKKPQPLLMEPGDVLVYPVCGGQNINPYFASPELDKQYTKEGPKPWAQDAWSAFVIIDSGRAFDFLSWYRPLTLAQARAEKPILDSLHGEVMWRLESPGTCSSIHFERMKLEKIGVFNIDRDKRKQVFPELRPGISAAVADISIANRMHVAPREARLEIKPLNQKGQTRRIVGIDQILSD